MNIISQNLNKMDGQIKKLVTQPEMADLLQCCAKHVYNLWRKGLISRVEGIGKLVRYDPRKVFGELGLEWNE